MEGSNGPLAFSGLKCWNGVLKWSTGMESLEWSTGGQHDPINHAPVV